MKPQLVKLNEPGRHAFNVIKYDQPYFGETWQFHPELELTLILESSGKQFIGDNIEDFGPGNLVLIGPNLLHLWKNDACYYKKSSTLRAQAIVIHFLKDFAGEGFLQLPELHHVRELFHKARRGIKFTGEGKRAVVNKIKRITNLDGIEKLTAFLTILNIIANKTTHNYLSTSSFVEAAKKSNDFRINSVFEYIMNHFSEPISLDEISEEANMTRTSFCRYFKKHTRKTFTQFLNEIRVGYACRLLQENKFTVAQICFTCGFTNLSHFNRQFKKIKRQTPTEYRKHFLN
jgi:AraC-like DNA-binding protein